METVQVRLFKAWLLYLLVAALATFAAGAAANVVLSGVLETAGMPFELISFVVLAADILPALALSYVSFRWSVHRFVAPQFTAGEIAPNSGPRPDRVPTDPLVARLPRFPERPDA